jgi:hypothetical protein
MTTTLSQIRIDGRRPPATNSYRCYRVYIWDTPRERTLTPRVAPNSRRHTVSLLGLVITAARDLTAALQHLHPLHLSLKLKAAKSLQLASIFKHHTQPSPPPANTDHHHRAFLLLRNWLQPRHFHRDSSTSDGDLGTVASFRVLFQSASFR